MPSELIKYPKKDSSFFTKKHFSGFSLSPACLIRNSREMERNLLMIGGGNFIINLIYTHNPQPSILIVKFHVDP